MKTHVLDSVPTSFAPTRQSARTETGKLTSDLVDQLAEHPPGTYLGLEADLTWIEAKDIRRSLRQRVIRRFPGHTLTMYRTEDGPYAIAVVPIVGRR